MDSTRVGARFVLSRRTETAWFGDEQEERRVRLIMRGGARTPWPTGPAAVHSGPAV